VMVIVRVVATCPVSSACHQRMRSGHGDVLSHVAVASIGVLAGTMPLHRLQVPCQFAGTRERRRTAPAAVDVPSC